MIKVAPNSREITFDRQELIVSKTDLRGKLTYANRVFMRVSNFSEADLLGKDHSIIRHPDMPRGVFYGLWKALKSGQEFFGFVKNITSDGHYYWVFANITPDVVNGEKVGFFPCDAQHRKARYRLSRIFIARCAIRKKAFRQHRRLRHPGTGWCKTCWKRVISPMSNLLSNFIRNILREVPDETSHQPNQP
ncbi:PAS domain-containing protein [Pseudobowmanella zhangzhouensis]|uniref:PAS domain-containing protein n=1 Tax=Pseudobowmanella zhangzhouensis TaxID=1537679 RepID=UPI00362338A3